MQIKIIIKTQRLTLSSNKIVCGTNNFIECLFDFQSSDWTELEKWALFKDGQNTYEMYIQDNKCIIPAQCISDQGEVIMSVVGRNNGKNITATAEDKLLLISGRAFDNPDEERLTPTYLEEVLGKVRDESLKAATSEANAAQSAQEAADSAAAALQSEKNAKASERAAETSKEAAAQSEANSKTSEDAARGYADDAEASKGAATTLAVNAAASANAAAESAKQATESEKKSAQSETNAKLSETNSKLSETNSQNSALESAQSAVNAEKSNKSAEKHSNTAGAFADDAELSAQQANESKNSAATSLAEAQKKAQEAAASAEEAEASAQEAAQSKADASKSKDEASSAASTATSQADRAQSAADGIRDTADTLQADNEHLKAELKHANRRISVLYDLGKGITHRYETDSETAYSKDVPSGAKVMDVKLIGGRSVASNQRIQDVKFETDIYANSVWHVYGSQPIIFNNNVAMFAVTEKWNGVSQLVEVIKNHKYYVYAEAKSDRENNTILCPYVQNNVFGTENSVVAHGTEWSNYAVMNTATKSTKSAIGVRAAGSTTVIGATISCKNIQCVDLTQMFGAGNEPTLEQFEAMLTRPDYPYNAGTLVSADVTAVQVGDKVISLPNSISLKSAGSVYDSLEFYEQDGKYYQKHTQRVGVVDLGTLTWKLLSTTDGIYWALIANQALYTTNYNCSYYTPSPKYYNELNDMEITGKGGNGGACWIKNTAIGSPDDLKASLPGVLLYYELATPIVTITEIDNRFDAVDVSTGDKITFVGNSNYHLPVPNEEEYLIALNEVTP